MTAITDEKQPAHAALDEPVIAPHESLVWRVETR
jgi:hypothetical protein